MATITEKEIREMADEWGRLQLKIAPIAAKADRLEKQIKAWMKATGRKVTITGDVAIAMRADVTKFGPREMTLAAFLEATADVDQADREHCLKVEIGKAEELLGKLTVDRLSDRPTIVKTVETLELKAQDS